MQSIDDQDFSIRCESLRRNKKQQKRSSWWPTFIAAISAVSALASAGMAYYQAYVTQKAVIESEHTRLLTEYAGAAYEACGEYVPPQVREYYTDGPPVTIQNVIADTSARLDLPSSITLGQIESFARENRAKLVGALEKAIIKGRTLTIRSLNERQRAIIIDMNLEYMRNAAASNEKAFGHNVQKYAILRSQCERMVTQQIAGYLDQRQITSIERLFTIRQR